MTRARIVRWSRTVGHGGWWVFVVGSLFAGGINWWNTHQSIAASFGPDCGWTMFAPMTRVGGAGYVDVAWQPTYTQWWQDPGVYALIAFIVVVITALIDACASRQVITGVVTVVVPFAALGLFVTATPDSVMTQPHTVISMLLVLAAVALREVWMRACLPRWSPTTTFTEQ